MLCKIDFHYNNRWSFYYHHKTAFVILQAAFLNWYKPFFPNDNTFPFLYTLYFSFA
jgi:hypothetical protein